MNTYKSFPFNMQIMPESNPTHRKANSASLKKYAFDSDPFDNIEMLEKIWSFEDLIYQNSQIEISPLQESENLENEDKYTQDIYVNVQDKIGKDSILHKADDKTGSRENSNPLSLVLSKKIQKRRSFNGK